MKMKPHQYDDIIKSPPKHTYEHFHQSPAIEIEDRQENVFTVMK